MSNAFFTPTAFNRAIFSAAAHALRAVDYLHRLQPGASRPPHRRPRHPRHSISSALWCSRWSAAMTDRDGPPDKTPWGQKDFEHELLPGFTMVSTSGHGGLYLTANQREAIPDALKPHSAGGKGMWWEEDCAWSLP